MSMSNGLQAIETQYNGYRFRSRLEARWAVFLDALGLRYEYEAQGYKLANGRQYLPDFWLPEIATYAEIKPDTPDALKTGGYYCARLCRESGKPAMLLVGTPYFGEYHAFRFAPMDDVTRTMIAEGDPAYCMERGVSGKPVTVEDDVRVFHHGVFSLCVMCGGALSLENEGGIWTRLQHHRDGCLSGWPDTDSARLDDAYSAARSARFEHGETPIPRRRRASTTS